jgi:hypothetical protein
MSNLVLLVPLLTVALILTALIGARLDRLQDRLAELSRVEAKLDLLLAGQYPVCPLRQCRSGNCRGSAEPQENRGNKIATGTKTGTKWHGLKEAKDFIEEVVRRAGVTPPRASSGTYRQS